MSLGGDVPVQIRCEKMLPYSCSIRSANENSRALYARWGGRLPVLVVLRTLTTPLTFKPPPPPPPGYADGATSADRALQRGTLLLVYAHT
jgi:hypothetical protein